LEEDPGGNLCQKTSFKPLNPLVCGNGRRGLTFPNYWGKNVSPSKMRKFKNKGLGQKEGEMRKVWPPKKR